MRWLIDPETSQSCKAAYFRPSGATSIDAMDAAVQTQVDATLERLPQMRRVFRHPALNAQKLQRRRSSCVG